MRVLRPIGWLGTFLAIVYLAGAARGQAQQGAPEPEKIRIKTVDGVSLQGRFYAGKNQNSATVVLLHALGDNSKTKHWTHLAETLKAKGFAVLAFDFRGHGGSKQVDAQLFWNALQFPHNSRMVKGPIGKSSIEFQDFDRAYYPVLVNDIAAVKAFLDRKNDNKECNSSSLILIGADTGATLGAVWLNAEWARYKVKQPFPLSFETRPEGADTICAIWLSINPYLGSRLLNLPSLLHKAAKLKATPMIFLYGEADKKSRDLCKFIEKSIVTPKSTKFKLTKAVAVPKTNLKGAELLQKSLPTAREIADYLDGIVQDKGNEWSEKDYRNSAFYWIRSTVQPMPAKRPTEANLIWTSYEQFIPWR
jgi:hypothetical protein